MINPYQLTDQVKLLQKMVLIHQDQFLILQRSPDAHSRPGQWDLPGGNALWPTTNTDLKNPHLVDLTREIAEETGFDLTATTDLISLRLIYLGSYFEVKNNTYAVIAGYTLVLPQHILVDSIRLSSEHTNWAWITPAEFQGRKYDFGFAGGSDGFITQMVKAVYG